MKNLLFILIYLSLSSFFYSQQITNIDNPYNPKKRVLLNQENMISIPADLESKILSGKLIQNISEKKFLFKEGLINKEEETEKVVLYFETFPSGEQINTLEALNIRCFLESWTPPLPNHPYGFILAELPADKLLESLSLSFIKKMDTSEYENFPQNNTGVISINADDVWLDGFDGTGVKVAVLDSGIDTFYDGSEFPASFERMDYSNYPTSIDPIVENSTTGHGTHVAGTVLARGTNSIGRSNADGNGSTPFKGSAPGADLTFLKIGGDVSSSATSAAMIGAMDAAVNIYDADVLSMSYGGWYTYHDGSSDVEQKVDWVYSQGKPFFLSAGNSGGDAHHYSGTVAAGSNTGYIAINTNSGSALTFNLVWYDGLGTNNNLYMQYYNSALTLLAKSESPTTESIRGTESKYSFHTSTVPAGTYYIRVFNTSANSQFFHIYFDDWGYTNITFVAPDPSYTIGQPASADNGFAVGSYVSRTTWVASDGSGPYWYGATFVLNGIAPYSSRGPRVDGQQKPNITAPGSAIISLRDTDVLTVWDPGWIDNDGSTGTGNANYYVMTGTSMACPITAGAAALLLDKEPTATPQIIYNAMQNSASTSGTGTVPNNTWGYGKLDVLAASELPLPVELSSFTATTIGKSVKLIWQTATEVNNYGFEIERKSKVKGLISNDWEKIGFVNGNGNTNSPKNYSYLDSKTSSGKYFYRLKQLDNDGQFEYSSVVEVDLGNRAEYSLEQNYPNPFNPTTSIRYSLPEQGNVKIKLFDLLGQEVQTIIDETKEAGTHSIYLNAKDLNSGVYLYKIESGSFVQIRKMIFLK